MAGHFNAKLFKNSTLGEEKWGMKSWLLITKSMTRGENSGIWKIAAFILFWERGEGKKSVKDL